MTDSASDSQQIIQQLQLLLQKQSGEPNTGGLQTAMEMLDELRKQTGNLERQLNNTEARVRTLVSAIPVGLLVSTTEGRVEAANPAVLELFRCNFDDQLRNKHLSELFQLDASPANTEFAPGHFPLNIHKEAIARQSDGGSLPVDILACPFSAAPGAERTLIVVQDISNRKALEHMKSEFIAMLTHDLKTPLTSIQLFLELVGAGRYDEEPEAGKAKAVAIERETHRLLDLINSLLDVDKLESGRLDMFFDVASCALIVNKSLPGIETMAEQKGVSLNILEFDPMLHVKADTHYVIQVMVNLLSNAIKFSPAGSDITLAVQPLSDNSFVRFLVKDNGDGISDDFKKRIFNRFEQAQISDARVKGGSGLGLSIARAIVTQHGGEIDFESEQGKGTTFWFTLPRVML